MQVKGDFKWEILFIFGGGAMLAKGSEETGFTEWISHQLATLGL